MSLNNATAQMRYNETFVATITGMTIYKRVQRILLPVAEIILSAYFLQSQFYFFLVFKFSVSSKNLLESFYRDMTGPRM